jgi:spore coat protein U-like protein
MHELRVNRGTATALTALLAIAAISQLNDLSAADLNVSAKVVSSCSVASDVALNFQTVDPQLGVPAGTVFADIPIECTGNATVEVTLGGGQNMDGSKRFMKNGSSTLEYILRNNGADWLPEQTRQDDVTFGTLGLIRVDGVIPVQSGVGAGDYSDKVLITVATVQ